MGLVTGFFSTVEYGFNAQPDNSIYGKLERSADFLRKPRNWVLAELGISRQVHTIFLEDTEDSFKGPGRAAGIVPKFLRIVIGIVAFALGSEIFATVLMGLAYISKEVRDKHRYAALKDKNFDSNKTLTNTERFEYMELPKRLKIEIDKRTPESEPKQMGDLACIALTTCGLFCVAVSGAIGTACSNLR